MCSIIDANVAGQLAGKNPPEAGRRFLDYVDSGKLVLVLGGKLRHELDKTSLRPWLQEAILAGRVRSFDDRIVHSKQVALDSSMVFRSDDSHIIALALVSGARLLYSNDKALHADFKNSNLVDAPRGRIYSTLRYSAVRESHIRLLENTSLCRSGA